MGKPRINRAFLQTVRSGMAGSSPARLPEYETVTDADGEVSVVPRKTLTLVEKLMVRAGAMAAPVQAPKRGRGRPRKAVQQ